MRNFSLIAVLAFLLWPARAHAADPKAGLAKAAKCKICYGLDGIAKIAEAPHIGGESSIYLKKQLKAFRSGARVHPQMSVIAKGLSDDDIADLAACYSRIKVTTVVPTFD